MAHGTKGKLSDFPEARLAFSCMLCLRRGESRTGKLMAEFGDVSLADLLSPFAAARGCTRALAQANDATPHGGVCRIRVTVPSLSDASPPRTIGTCYKQGWRLTVRCDSRRAGIKSKHSCSYDVRLDVFTLVGAFGPDADAIAIGSRLYCPQCGKRGVITFWTLPGDRAGAAAG